MRAWALLLLAALLLTQLTKPYPAAVHSPCYCAVCPEPTPNNILQLLAAGVVLHITGNPEAAIAMLSAALSGVWPPSRDLQRRIVARQFVPTWPPADAAAGAGATAAGAEADGSSERISIVGGSGSGSHGNHQSQHAEGPAATTDPEASAAVVEAASRTAALVTALDAALQQHCPGVCRAGEVQRCALVLRLFLGCRAVGEQAGGASPAMQAVVRSLLVDCQQLLEVAEVGAEPGDDPQQQPQPQRCIHAAVWAAQLLLYARWPLEARAVRQLYLDSIQRCTDARCWLAAGEVRHDFALSLVKGAAAQRNVAERQAALLEASSQLAEVTALEGRLKPWLPAGRLAQLTQRRLELVQLLGSLQSGMLRPSSSAAATAGEFQAASHQGCLCVPTCAACLCAAPHVLPRNTPVSPSLGAGRWILRCCQQLCLLRCPAAFTAARLRRLQGGRVL